MTIQVMELQLKGGGVGLWHGCWDMCYFRLGPVRQLLFKLMCVCCLQNYKSIIYSSDASQPAQPPSGSNGKPNIPPKALCRPSQLFLRLASENRTVAIVDLDATTLLHDAGRRFPSCDGRWLPSCHPPYGASWRCPSWLVKLYVSKQ